MAKSDPAYIDIYISYGTVDGGVMVRGRALDGAGPRPAQIGPRKGFLYRAHARGPLPAGHFDLNMPGHQNSDKGMRCHLHPGHDDLQAPSALMTPVELLELFVYGLALPARPRAQ